MELLKYPLTLRHLKRVREITGVLIKHGFSDIAERLHFSPYLFRLKNLFKKKQEIESRKILKVEERIRLILEELGPTFIKLGQVMATRPDLIPMNLVIELKKLHDNVPSFPFNEVLKLMKEELGEKVSEYLESIEEKSTAAASIAQVHKAKLKDGTNVVIKVQRPNIYKKVRSDLEILKALAKLLHNRIPEIRQFNPIGLVEEFSHSLYKEMDFKNELYNLQRYAKNFNNEPLIYIPKSYPHLCTEKILTMEDVTGVKITNREELEKMGIDLMSIARLGIRVTIRSIFEFGFFHADPHPGNFFIKQNGTVSIVDFGMMGILEPQRIDELLQFLASILMNDIDMMINLFFNLDLISDETDIRRMRMDVGDILERYQHRRLDEINVSSFIAEVFEVVVRHKVQLPSDLLLVARAIATMEGIAHEISPDFNPLEEIRPYLISIYMKRALDPLKHSKNLYRGFSELLILLKDAPRDLRKVLKKLGKGELPLQVKFHGREDTLKQREKHFNKIIYAVVSPAFLFCGIYALNLKSEFGSILSIVSLSISGVFFISLIKSTFFSKRR